MRDDGVSEVMAPSDTFYTVNEGDVVLVEGKAVDKSGGVGNSASALYVLRQDPLPIQPDGMFFCNSKATDSNKRFISLFSYFYHAPDSTSTICSDNLITRSGISNTNCFFFTVLNNSHSRVCSKASPSTVVLIVIVVSRLGVSVVGLGGWTMALASVIISLC